MTAGAKSAPLQIVPDLPAETPVLLTREEVRVLLHHKSTGTLAHWAVTKKPGTPRSRLSGRMAVYLKSDVDRYILSLFDEAA